MRVAVIDLGTNSTRLLVAEVEGACLREIERHSKVTCLGEGVDSSGEISPQAIERTCATLADYSTLIAGHGVEKTVVVATSAVREAANGRALVAVVKERFGWDVEVLTGEREAELTYRGATGDHLVTDSLVVVDIGGGSTELVVGSGSGPRFSVSTEVGSVRYTERHLASDPPTSDELRDLRGEVRAAFEETVPQPIRAVVMSGIAVAGTPTSLAAIEQSLDPYDPAKVHGYRLRLSSCERMIAELAALSLERRRQVTGLHPDRAYAIVAGTAILIEAMEVFRLDGVQVSEHDLLYGAALGAAETAPRL